MKSRNIPLAVLALAAGLGVVAREDCEEGRRQVAASTATELKPIESDRPNVRLHPPAGWPLRQGENMTSLRSKRLNAPGPNEVTR